MPVETHATASPVMQAFGARLARNEALYRLRLEKERAAFAMLRRLDKARWTDVC
jgi:hypothetical protein